MIEFPIKQNSMQEYQKHSSYHLIILDCYITYSVEVRILIIQQPTSKKLNVYLIDYDSYALFYKNADEFVLNLDPMPIGEAQRLFPTAGFNSNNYGF